jgi:hypothetical protein
MSGLGLYPLGEELGPFGGPGLITILGVIPIGRSEIAIVFDRRPKLDDDGAWNDASDTGNYLLLAIDPTELTEQGEPFIPKGKFKATRECAVVEATRYTVDTQQVILTLDAPLEKFVDYELTVLYVRGADGETYAGPTSWSFRALAPGLQEVKKHALTLALDPYNDIANGFAALGPDGKPGLTGWQLADDQNFVHHGGLANARKRIHRRMFSGRGKYQIYGNGYGVDWPSGSLMRPGSLNRLAAAIAQQIRREPDVIGCSVIARVGTPGMVDIEARAQILLFGPTVVRQSVAF